MLSRPARQRPHDRPSANSHASIHERIQQMPQDVINHLLVHRLPARKTKRSRQFLGDLQPDGMPQRVARTVDLVRQRDGRLQYRSRLSVDIKLAARKPPQIAGIGGIKQQQGRLPAGRGQIMYKARSVSSIRYSKPACLAMLATSSGSSSRSRNLWSPADKTCMPPIVTGRPD